MERYIASQRHADSRATDLVQLEHNVAVQQRKNHHARKQRCLLSGDLLSAFSHLHHAFQKEPDLKHPINGLLAMVRLSAPTMQ